MSILMSLVSKIIVLNGNMLEFLVPIWKRAALIIKEPILSPSMIWILLPLLITLFLMQLYFGRYTREKLGWNSALGNAIVLFFVGMNLLSWLHSNNLLVILNEVDNLWLIKNILAIGLVGLSLILMYLNFFHFLPKGVAFNLSSSLVVNYIAAISIVVTYSNIELSVLTLKATILLFVILLWVVKTLQVLEPNVEPVKEEEELKEELQQGKEELIEVKKDKIIKNKEKEEMLEEIKKKVKEKMEKESLKEKMKEKMISQKEKELGSKETKKNIKEGKLKEKQKELNKKVIKEKEIKI